MRIRHLPLLTVFTCLIAWTTSAQTPFNVTGLGDKTNFNNSVTFSVATEPGYTYGVYLNGTNVSAGGVYTIRHPDFYWVEAMRTNTASAVVTSRLFRIIVMDTSRSDTERGLPTHTPLIAIPSSPQEFAGAWLRLIAPRRFPAGYEIPVVAWVHNPQQQGKTMRGNGWIVFPQSGSGEYYPQPPIFLRRGVGSGFLSSNTPPGFYIYTAALKDYGDGTNLMVNVQESTTWTPVSGTLSGNVAWPADSRIHVTAGVTLTAGSTLTIGAGTIVRLNPGVTVTNNGNITINGTHHEPVVFMPNSHSQYWGGFQMRSGQGVVNANYTIFTGSGAAPNWFSGGHRLEQALFDDNQSLTLTDCAMIASAGQFGRNGGVMTLTRLLVQNAVSAGEYSGASLRVNDSAFIEFPDDTSNFVNADNDAIYLDDGNHAFTNTLFGWTKDDGIDSGASGSGTIYYESCWFESTFHEGNSLSGFKDVYPRNTVYIDCGQGHEVGYDAPNGFVDGCLFLGNKSGLRHGDNYTSMSGYGGLLTASNSILLFNHRDVFAYNWDSPGGWTNNWGQVDVRDNWLTKPDTNFPDNAVWEPVNDGWRLARFSTAPGDAKVGVGMALRGPQVTLAQLTNGIPVRLSTFSTNFVSVRYAIENADAVLATGTLQFVPGEIVKYVRATPAQVQNQSLVRIRLENPVRADITANPVAYYSVGVTQAPPQLIFPANSVWRYPSVAGAMPASWTNLTFNDSTWGSGAAQLGFNEGDEATLIPNRNQITYYFRRIFNIDDPSAFASLAIDMIRDDGGVIYINGAEIFRSPNMPQPPAVIGFNTTTISGQNGENDRDQATTIAPLVAGQNIAAVEMHQADVTSSDISFSLRLDGLPAPRLELRQFRGDWLLFWADPGFKLQQADTLNGPWTTLATPSPVQVDLSAATRFYRLMR